MKKQLTTFTAFVFGASLAIGCSNELFQDGTTGSSVNPTRNTAGGGGG